MSIFDALKNSVLEGFNTSLTITEILLGLAVSLLAGLFILLIYKNTQSRAKASGDFNLTILLITSISAMIVLTITSNLALSLGMVGALSIVRFRTAIKDATDTAFLFWCVAAGITAGAGFYLITLIGCLFIGVICVVSMFVLDGAAKTYLLVVRMDGTEVSDRVESIFEKYKMNYKLSTLTQNADYAEAIYEVAFAKKYKGIMSGIKNTHGVRTMSLVDCRKS
ncbi:MAG: DUF4956 domain-containing protein [Oscillospiraceae bacterium]|nr:DUF4956 domain-containing protein [Oscillospiraceae bacterium]